MAEYIKTKTILSRLNGSPDPYFGISYSMNLYRGCQHQCIYCDSRSTVYRLGDLSKIRIKQNALSLLEKELKNKRKKGTVGTGSMNDPYMPVEKGEELTRQALKLLLKFKFPVHVITKSDLVTRDIDILAGIGKTYSAVSFTITTPDDELSQIIEPGAPVSSKRFSAMQKLAEAGIYTGVLITPVLPFITDKEDHILKLVGQAKNSGASYIIAWMGMTQREGQREYYYNKLDKHFPDLRYRYAQTFSLNYQCSSPSASKLYNVFKEACLKYDIPMQMKFFKEQNPNQLKLF